MASAFHIYLTQSADLDSAKKLNAKHSFPTGATKIGHLNMKSAGTVKLKPSSLSGTIVVRAVPNKIVAT